IFLSTLTLPPTSPLFPYTTLFRSLHLRRIHHFDAVDHLILFVLDGLFRVFPVDCNQIVGFVGGSVDLQKLRRFLRVVGGEEGPRSEEHTSELQSRENLVCRLLLEK